MEGVPKPRWNLGGLGGKSGTGVSQCKKALPNFSTSAGENPNYATGLFASAASAVVQHRINSQRRKILTGIVGYIPVPHPRSARASLRLSKIAPGDLCAAHPCAAALRARPVVVQICSLQIC